MRELLKTMGVGIELPSHSDDSLRRDLPLEFKLGKYYLSIGAVEIGKYKQIKVNYHEVSTTFAEAHVVKVLFSHLSTSGLPRFAELVGDKGKLADLKQRKI
jgi:hypothetical protein